jgi:peptidyl-dipeptidase Dcp
MMPETQMPTIAENPLLAPWTGPYGGAPAFDSVKIGDFASALDEAMARYRSEIQRIAVGPEPATFANTLEALERTGAEWRRVTSLLSTFTSTMNNAAMRAIQRNAAPKLAAFRDEIFHNRALFDRIETVFQTPAEDLNAEQQRLAFVMHQRFSRQGAGLAQPDKDRLAAINQRLASLYTNFSQNILADEEDAALVLEDRADLDGLPPDLIEAAATAADERGLKGCWAIANTRSSVEPFMTLSSRRDLREKAFWMWSRRGDNGGEHDNNGIITEVLRLRLEKARLLGHETFAHWVTDGQMAKTPQAALNLLHEVWTPAAARAREEVVEMQALAAAEGANEPIEPWDYRYYAEKLRKAKFDLSDDEVKPYLQLHKLREGMFWAAGELFGLSFSKVDDLPVYHPDV